MLFYPKEHIIAGRSLYFEYDKELIEEFTNKLNADNFVYFFFFFFFFFKKKKKKILLFFFYKIKLKKKNI